MDIKEKKELVTDRFSKGLSELLHDAQGELKNQNNDYNIGYLTAVTDVIMLFKQNFFESKK